MTAPTIVRRAGIGIVTVGLVLSLSACGRKGTPVPPADSTYPRTYPAVVFPPRTDGADRKEQTPPATPQPQTQTGTQIR